MYKTEKDIQDRIKEHFNNVMQKSPTLEYVGICAHGSMNYGLMYKDSDVDTKMLVLPNLKQLVLNKKPTNKTYIIDPTEEHCDVKDIRDYFKIFRKQNINFVEILFTKYSIINSKYADIWHELLSRREELARMNEYAAISCIKGMAIQKREVLCHPYPSKLEILEKYGYDPKQLHHLARLWYFLQDYIGGKPYSECLIPTLDIRDELLSIKTNAIGYDVNDAIDVADYYTEIICNKADSYRDNLENKINPEMDKFLDKILYKLMVRYLGKELEWLST